MAWIWCIYVCFFLINNNKWKFSFRGKHIWYFGFTICYMILPFLVSFCSKSIEVLRGKAKKRDLIECLYHLPVLQVIKLTFLLKKQFKAINELEKARQFQKRVKPLIKQSKSMEENNEWSPAGLKKVASLKPETWEKDFIELSRLIKKKHG